MRGADVSLHCDGGVQRRAFSRVSRVMRGRFPAPRWGAFSTCDERAPGKPLAWGRRVWVSRACAAGDISRTFAPASWSPGASRACAVGVSACLIRRTSAGASRACAAGDAWRAQRRARERVFSAVCKSPAMCNSDLQRTALRGSKAASSGGRFLRAPRAGPSLWGRQGRGEKSPWDLLLTSCGVLRRRCARRRTWCEPCPMRRRYSPRRGTWSEQAENCRHLDFSFPSLLGRCGKI